MFEIIITLSVLIVVVAVASGVAESVIHLPSTIANKVSDYNYRKQVEKEWQDKH